MTKFIIQGPAKLEGTLRVGGSKNAVLKIMAGCLLATEPVTLRNVPAISEVGLMLEVLAAFGMQAKHDGDVIHLDPSALHQANIPDDLARRLRSSVVTLGPALSRFGQVSTLHPGGDIIGKRSIEVHLKAFADLGAAVSRDDLRYSLSATKLSGAEIFLEEASVTATENAIMAAVLAEGRTLIHNAASELHTKDLCVFLNTLGAKITGGGTNLVTIDGVASLQGGDHTIRPDEIEAGTFAIAAALTSGTVTLTHVDPRNFGMILVKLREAGINFTETADTLTIKGPHNLKGTSLKTHTWPGFPSDLQPPFTVLMTQASGMSLIHDHMYEGRLFYTDKLVSMGANITMADPHRVIVYGPTELLGRELASPDIRAGMTMLLAGLVARGTTVIEHAEHIERGYANLDSRLRELGVDITRVNGDSPSA